MIIRDVTPLFVSQVLQILQPYLKEYPLQTVAELIEDTTTIEDNRIVINYKLPVGKAKIGIECFARSDGRVELVIKESTVLGFAAFGSVKKLIGDTLISKLNQYPKWFKAEKLNGNVVIAVNYVRFSSITIKEVLSISAKPSLTFKF